MRPTYYLRVFVLIAALALVFAAINGVRPQHFQKFFGVFEGQGDTRGNVAGGFFRLCHTRILSLEFPDGKKVEETKAGAVRMKWIALDPKPSEMNYLEVEKWLGRNCRVPASAVDNAAAAKSAPGSLAVSVAFINGATTVIETLDENVFRVGDEVFKSPELTQALADLRRLAQFE